MLLSHEELKAKTGWKQPARLRRWLVENGIPFLLDQRGRAITTSEAITKSIAEAQATEPEVELI